jgi:hypothetical protein
VTAVWAGSFDITGTVRLPAKDAVAAWSDPVEIFSGRDWHDSTNDRKQQLSSFSFMGWISTIITLPPHSFIALVHNPFPVNCRSLILKLFPCAGIYFSSF